MGFVCIHFPLRKHLDADLRNRHICIVGYAIIMGVFAVIFHYIGISMGWLYEVMGTILGCAVIPIALCISVKKANRMGCVVGTLAGFASGITG
jgi:Na+/proline symporter